MTLARDLWQSGYRDTGRDDRHWFKETEQGLNDEHPIALRLWPRRVCEQAIARESLAMAHGLKPPPKLAHMNPELAATQRDKWLHLMSSRFGVEQDDRDYLRATFGNPEPLSSWREWWEQLDGGALDDLAVARYARPAELAERCHTTVELARAHEVVSYFFVDTGDGLRARLEPKDEIFREVSEKTSSAVKAALRNFVDAPGIASGTRRTRDRRGASTTVAGGGR